MWPIDSISYRGCVDGIYKFSDGMTYPHRYVIEMLAF